MTIIRCAATEFPVTRLQRLFIVRRERARKRARRVLTRSIARVLLAMCVVLLAAGVVSCLMDR